MANEDDCRAALDRIAGRLAEVDADRLAEHAVERTISCQITDLGVAYRTRLHAGGLDPFEPAADAGTAQVRITVGAADLIALAADELNPAKAWATGRLKIEASFFDLLRLRKLL
ncbi:MULTISPECIES: SCP2 sterol-binding domain-containing protein [Thermomonosporaceae]|uniref:SCP2 sterol-binding domain-containing protein n=1 Tax=Thermomonosporaceae TaxID=2012 RepID=UPI00255A979E|nr:MULTISPECIES: SCP2 sterol-binding domain-containing protein [Thermomonosporaceae]MDL4777232.1 SCP2 sterol-binding domain-containing protein [Actinomadura xylanilytica]